MSRITRFILTLAVISLIGFIDLFAATTPSRQAAHITVSNVTANLADLTLLRGNGNKRVIVISEDATVDSPVNGTQYTDADGDRLSGDFVDGGSSDRVIDVLVGPQWQATLSNLQGGQTYYIQVFEFNEDGSTPVTAYNTGTGTNNPRSFTTPIVVNAPINLAAANVTATTADFSWEDGNTNPLAEGYLFTLYVDSDGEGSGNSAYDANTESTVSPFIELDLGDEPSLDLTDLVGASDYKYEVTAYIGSTNSNPTTFEFFTPDDATPPDVISIALTGQTGIGGTIYEGDAGNNVTLTVTFSEAMKTWLTPTFTFTNTTDLTYVTGSWNPAGDVFTATFLVSDSDEEFTDEDVTIGNAEDLVGQSIALGNDIDTDVFSIDNEDGVLSNFNYTTAGTNDNQPVCKSAVNNDVIEFEIDLAEDGYAASGIGNHNFVVVAEDQNNNNQIVFSSTDTLEGTYLFSAMLAGTEAEDDYNLIIQFTDGAGNVVEDLSNTNLFRIDNTNPVISNFSITGVDGSILSGFDTDTLVFEFDATDIDGCGSIDASNISIAIYDSTTTDSVAVNSISGPTINGSTYEYQLVIDSSDFSDMWVIDITLTDDAGNSVNSIEYFEIDNIAPTLVGIGGFNQLINEADTASVYAYVLQFSELLDSAFEPIMVFVDEYDNPIDLSPTLTQDSVGEFYGSPQQIWSTYFSVMDGNQEELDVALKPTNIRDIAGNYFTPASPYPDSLPAYLLNWVYVDNIQPVISNFTYNGGVLCRSGSNGDTLIVTIDIADSGYEPETIDGNSFTVVATGVNDTNNILTFSEFGTPTTDVGTYTFAYILDGLDPEDTYDLEIIGKDGADNSSIPTVNNNLFTIDNTAPIISNLQITGADGSCLSSNDSDVLDFTFNVVEEGCGTFNVDDVAVSIDGPDSDTPSNSLNLVLISGDGSVATPYLFAGFFSVHTDDADGAWNISVDATDDAGNTSTTLDPSGAEFTVDNTAPVFTAASVAASCENGGDIVTLTFSVTESGCGTFDGTNLLIADDVETDQAWTYVSGTGVGPYTYTLALDAGDPDGLVTVAINGTDDAGNIADENTDASFTIDNTTPTIANLTIVNSCLNTADDLVFSFDAYDDGCGTFDINDIVVTTGLADITPNIVLNSGDGSSGTPYNYTFTYDVSYYNHPTLPDNDGDYNITIVATDDAGNVSNYDPAGVEFSVDNTLHTPGPFTYTTPTCLKAGDSVSITFEVYDDGCGIFDETNFSFNTSKSPSNDPGLTDPGTLSILSGAGTSADPYLMRLSFDIAGGDADGAYNISVGFTDAAGNGGSRWTNHINVFNVDNTAPLISALSVTPSCVTTDEVVTITFSVEEEGCGTFNADDIELTIDDSGFGPEAIYEPTVTLVSGSGTNADPYDFSATFTILTSHIDGEYLVIVTATDDAGNVDTDGETFDVDQTPPTLSNLVTSSVPGGSPTKVGGAPANRELTIEFDEETTGCADFDDGTITYIITGPSNTAFTQAIPAPSDAVIAGTWVTTVTVPSNEPSGDYQIIIIAEDSRGNADTLDPAGVEFVIDNTPPQVSSITTSHTPAGPFPPAPVLNRADDDNNAPEFYIDVVYNEALDAGQGIPTLEFHIPGKNPTSPVAALTFGVATRPNANTLRYPYDLDNATNIDMRTIGVRINGLNDVVGNTQTVPNTKGSLFGIDFQTPQLNSVTPTPTFVVDGSSQLGLLFSFSEDMKTDVKPTVSFDAGNGPDNDSLDLILTFNEPQSIWNSAQLFTAKFDVDGSHPLDSDPIAVGLTVATDLAGNPFPGSNESGVFIVDTKEPTCVSVTTNPAEPVVNLGDLDFDVTVVMDQSLDNGITPTITFATSSAFSVSGGAYSTTSDVNDTYTFTVTHNGTTEEEHEEIMTITGFEDLAGNPQVIACLDTFDVDTDRPDVVSVTVTDDKICGDDDEGTVDVVITFDEDMNPAVDPDITFLFDIVGNGILTTSGPGTWSVGNTVYTETFDIDASLEHTINDVDIIVNTAEDLLGNVMLESTTADTIDVDTELPELVGIEFQPLLQPNPFGINRANIGNLGFQIVLEFDEPMNQAVLPQIIFPGNPGLPLQPQVGSWDDATHFILPFHVVDQPLELLDIPAQISLGQDLCGNIMTQETPEEGFNIDLIAPTCDDLDREYSTVFEGQLVQELFVSFSEPMQNTINPEFNFTSTNFSVGTGTWDANDEFSVFITHNGTEEEIPIEIVTLNLVSTQPIDLAGNPMLAAACSTQFEIDTRKPLVSSVTFSPEKIIATTSSFFVTVVFDEDMKAAPNPTIGFNATLTGLLNYIGYTTPSTNTFVYEYGVTDADLELMDIDIDIAIGEDVAGNVMSTHTSSETFNIDQVEPTVTSVTFSSHPGWINRTDIGNGNFTVTVVYDEAMDNTIAPTIDLDPFAQGNPVLSDALVFASGAWSTGSNTDDTYTATYNVVDVAFAGEQLGATISGGKDACGNTQVTYESTTEGDGTIDIDLVNPTVVFDGFTPLAESCVNGTEAIDFTAGDVDFFDEVQARIGGAAFVTYTTSNDLNTISGWGTASDGPITIELKALDFAGNSTTISRNFTKDATAPVIGGESFTNTCVTTGDVIDIEFTITETGCGTIVANNITASGFPTGNGVLSQPTITGNNPYVVTATYTVGSTDAQGAYNITFEVTDDAGNDATPSVNNSAFTIDKTAPNYSSFGPASPSCANSSDVVTLVFTSDDNTFGCGPYGASNITASTSLGAATVITLGSPFYLISVDLSGTTSANDGTYDIDIVMTDAAGNVRNETITNAFTIDNTAPAITNVQVTPGCENGGGLVTLTFDVVEDGCGTFDQNDITINDNVTTNNAWTFSGESEGTYTYTLLIDITDPDGAVDVTVDATDDAGNSSTGNDSGDTDFTIDNSAPDIAFDEPLTGATVNGSKEILYTADDNDGCGIDYTQVRINTGTWVTISSSGTYLSDLTEFNSLGDVGFTLNIRSIDIAGNIGTNSVSLTKDATDPDVTSVTPSDNVISIADHGTPFTVAVLFTEGMDTGTIPVVQLTANNTVAVSNTGGSWSAGNTIYTATFGNIDALSTPETIASLGVTVSNVKDDTEDIGNTMDFPVGFSSVFSIDTEAPTCLDITNNNADIYENDLSVAVSVQFTEDMATSPNPTFIITGTTELTPGASNWSGDTYTQTFTHTGFEEETSAKFEINEFATLPTDLAGNPVSAVLCSTDVDIDTRKPLVSSVVFSPTLVTEATTTFSVLVTFNEDMSGSPHPTLLFNSPAESTMTQQGSSDWVNDTQYSFDYNVSDLDFDFDDITVDIFGSEDVAGNVMLTHTSTESFDIDQVAPTITDASIKSSNSIDDQYAKVGHDIILTITPSEELDMLEFSGNIAGLSFGLIDDDYSGNGVYIIPVTINSGVSEGLVTFSIDYEDVNGNAGTTLTAVTDPSSVTVDKTAPVGTIDLAGGQADPTSDSPINFALTFSEDVYGLTDGDIDVTGTAGATTAVVTGSGDTYNVAVTGMTGSGTVVINLTNGKVTDIAANGNDNTIITDNTVQYDVSGATDVAAGAGVEPATLSSLVDTQGEAVLNFDFDVTDDGVVPAADLLATLITDISVSQGTGNDFGDWTTILAGAELTDGTNTVAVTTINSNSLEFNGLATGAGQIGEVADDAIKTYTLKVWLTDSPTGVIDNLNLAFSVNRSSFTVDGAGSSFAGGAGTDVESGSTNNAIDVDATELTFTTTPANTEINTNTTFVIDATDENGNRDVDYGPSTVTLTANQSTISSGGSGTLASGTLTLSTVQFSSAFANDYVTAADGTLTDGVSDNFNIKEEEPSAITNLSIIPNSNSFKINFTNPDNKNTLIIAKKTSSTTISYSNEAGMDNETSWVANTNYGSSATPSDASTFVIYAGSGATSVTMYNLINNFNRYTIAAYAYAGALNSGVQNFNENETTKSGLTMPKGSNYSENIANGLRLGIDNITPQPASLNNVVSLQVETIEDMPLTLELYDSKGQKMMTLFEGRDFTSGETPFEFSLANTISSGQHFLRLTGNGHVVIAPIMIVK